MVWPEGCPAQSTSPSRRQTRQLETDGPVMRGGQPGTGLDAGGWLVGWGAAGGGRAARDDGQGESNTLQIDARKQDEREEASMRM